MPTLQAMVEENISVDISQDDPQAQKRLMWFAEKAARCAKKALNLEPENKEYQRLSRECYRLKAEILCGKERRF